MPSRGQNAKMPESQDGKRTEGRNALMPEGQDAGGQGDAIPPLKSQRFFFALSLSGF
jgi:hypothetical protein